MDTPECKPKGGDKKEKHKEMICLVDCHYKLKGAINDAGEINREKLLALIEHELKAPEFKPASTSALDKCLGESESTEKYLNNIFDKQDILNFISEEKGSQRRRRRKL